MGNKQWHLAFALVIAASQHASAMPANPVQGPVAAVARKDRPSKIKNLRELLAQADQAKAGSEIGEFLAHLAAHDVTLSTFSPSQKVFFYAEEFESEMNNGGVEQYLSNSSGDHANPCVAALQKLGRGDVGQILSQALKVFPQGSVPTSRAKRVAAIQHLNEKSKSRWEQLDALYYNKAGDLMPALVKYVRAHRSDF
jgi:hypothetical protein